MAAWLPGPGDPPGMRLAAERAARYLAAAARGYGLPEQAPWEAAAAALGAERARVDADLPLEGHGPLPPLPAPKVRPHLAPKGQHERSAQAVLHLSLNDQQGRWRPSADMHMQASSFMGPGRCTSTRRRRSPGRCMPAQTGLCTLGRACRKRLAPSAAAQEIG